MALRPASVNELPPRYSSHRLDTTLRACAKFWVHVMGKRIFHVPCSRPSEPCTLTGATIRRGFPRRPGGSRLETISQVEDTKRSTAIQLKQWLEANTEESTASRSALVFAQDLVPSELCPSASANNPVREYLDSGGRIVWIGDVPFWSKSLGTGKDREQIWRYGTHYAMLGVQPLLADSSGRTKWLAGPGDGLKSSWYSERPAAVEVSLTKAGRSLWSAVGKNWSSQDLAVTPLASAEVTLHPEAWNGLVITRWKKAGKRVGSVGLGAFGTSASVDWTEAFPKELSLAPLRLAAAWHVAFNRSHPQQGFYRFFDTGAFGTRPPAPLMEDLTILAERGQK